jgi:hypothetical protein
MGFQDMSAGEQWLLMVLRRPEVSADDLVVTEYLRLGREQALSVARLNWVEILVGHRLSALEGFPLADRRVWQEIHDQQVAEGEERLHWVIYVAQAFKAAGIDDFLLLKDSGLSLVAYSCRYCRKANDVDILVPKAAFPKLAGLVTPLGFSLDHEDPYKRPQAYLMEVSGQQEFSHPLTTGELRIEFHHRPLSGKWIQPEQEPDPVELFRRAQQVSLNGTQVKVLSNEDNLLHLCIHAAKHFFVLDKAIRMYVDIDRLVATGKVNWETFVQLTKRQEVELPVRVALRITNELMKSDVPDDVLAALATAEQREKLILRWVQQLGVFEPSGRKLSQLQRFLFYFILADSWDGSLRMARRTLFMPTAQLKLRYGFTSSWLIPYFYAHNLARVILKRRL